MSKYKFDETIFNNIDSEEKAYILGYLFADGYNNTNQHTVQLTLHKKDLQILEKFNKIIYPNCHRPIHKYGNLVRFSINNKNVSNQIAKFGCTQAKTFKLTFPDIIDNLIPHFIRGYLDGDGCIYIGRNQCELSLISTLSFCETIGDIIKNKFNFDQSISLKKDNGKDKIYRIRYMKRKQIIDILTWIYKNSTIHLDRKYNKYLELIEIENKPKKVNQYC